MQEERRQQLDLEALFQAGAKDLISITPPDAVLASSSRISPTSRGKVPGRRLPNGSWAGYNWRKLDATIDDVRAWIAHGANVGLRADRYPGVDIDCTDEQLAEFIEGKALALLGPAPSRTGRAPKRLLVYRTAEPFGRMRLWIDDTHLVEILGQGQQYVIYGIHPTTLQPYSWTTALTSADELTLITREEAESFVKELQQDLEAFGYKTEREGDGRPLSRSVTLEQAALLAPSVALVREAVELTPNTNELFPSRTDYLRMGYAIRAAVGDDYVDEGAQIFEDWAAKWEGNARFSCNDPQTVRDDWHRMSGPKSIGWSWLAEQARQFGFNDAALDFDAVSRRPCEPPLEPPVYSDQWLADAVVEQLLGSVRYVPQMGKFFVWQNGRWQRDELLLAESLILKELRKNRQ